MPFSFLANRRLFGSLAAVAVAAAATLPLPAAAQETPIKFQLDWRFEGPAALFLEPLAKGYFKAEKLNVTVDAGNGSGGTVTRVASGAYDMGFADLAALMEFQANNPTAPNKPVAVMMVYNNTPAAVLALKKSGIAKPAGPRRQEAGRAGVRRRAQGLADLRQGQRHRQRSNWTAMDPTLRETMLVRGDIDAITGFTFTSLLNLEARGVKESDVVVLPYPSYGVKLYGNAIIVSEAFLKKNPEAVKGVPARVLPKGMKDVIADPKAAIATLKARDGLDRRGARGAAPQACARHHRAHARREGRGLRQGARTAPDSLMAQPGLRRVRDQGPGSNSAAVWKDGFLPSGGRARHLQDGAESERPSTLAHDRLRRLQRLARLQRRTARPARASSRSRTSRSRSPRGEFIAIVGPSGCGKSTFMKLATGLRMPSKRPRS